MTLTQTLQQFDTARELEVDQAWRDLHAAIDSCRQAAHGGEYGSLPMLASAARVIRACLATIEPVQEGDTPEWTYACRRAVLGAAIAYCWTSSALWTVDTLNQACATAPTLDAAHRALSRQRFADAGWKLCPHPDCPPWSCRVTDPR